VEPDLEHKEIFMAPQHCLAVDSDGFTQKRGSGFFRIQFLEGLAESD
jgi:hypothetical protein